jgi:hypothetical protein
VAKLTYEVEIHRWPEKGTFQTVDDMIAAAKELRGLGWWWMVSVAPDTGGREQTEMTLTLQPPDRSTSGQAVRVRIGQVLTLTAGTLQALTDDEFTRRFGVAP